MDFIKYLKENYISIVVDGNVTEEEWKKYAEICKDKNCISRRDVDELVTFQKYYGVKLPIIRNCYADKNNVEIVK